VTHVALIIFTATLRKCHSSEHLTQLVTSSPNYVSVTPYGVLKTCMIEHILTIRDFC